MPQYDPHLMKEFGEGRSSQLDALQKMLDAKRAQQLSVKVGMPRIDSFTMEPIHIGPQKMTLDPIQLSVFQPRDIQRSEYDHRQYGGEVWQGANGSYFIPYYGPSAGEKVGVEDDFGTDLADYRALYEFLEKSRK